VRSLQPQESSCDVKLDICFVKEAKTFVNSANIRLVEINMAAAQQLLSTSFVLARIL
jgi:hypothetical protein